ncbi:MAG: hypothetical protein V7647_272 [Acidobacteriota bacterium]|jgi:glycosyltransferase involved in cell wall biosynthesis
MSAAALRILHVVPYYEHAWAYGGIPRLATTMTRTLARRGHAVTVCTTDVRDQTSRTASVAERSHGVDVRVFRNVSNRLAYHLQFFTPIGFRAHLRAVAGSFDVAHIHACHNLPGAFAAAALTRASVPYVVSPNGTAPPIERRVIVKRAFAATVGRHVLSGAARVLAVTNIERDQLATMGLAPTRITVVPNPVDEDGGAPPDGAAFRAAHGLGRARIVLFLGKLTPRKGVEHLIHAFSQLALPDTLLVIAGNDMGAGAACDRLVRRLALQARVVRTGLLRDTQRLDALRAADVVVYPSRDEIFGLVPLEALLCGTPVTVCGDSGCGEIIGKVGGGRLVPYGAPAALADAIASILSNPAEWKERVAAAAPRVRRLFGADVVCDELERVYVEVCGAAAHEKQPA